MRYHGTLRYNHTKSIAMQRKREHQFTHLVAKLRQVKVEINDRLEGGRLQRIFLNYTYH